MARKTDEKPSITVRRVAMNLLARREQSFFELVQKLTRKFPDFDKHETILPALEKLREENLQSDERFVEAYVRYHLTRGMGPMKISMELGQKGANDNLIQNEIYNTEIDWVAHCREVLNRKYPEGFGSTIDERQKLHRFLSQRGFEGEHIRKAADKNT
jgi:regulatory protein